MSEYTHEQWVANLDLIGHILGDQEGPTGSRWQPNALIAIEQPYFSAQPGDLFVRIVRLKPGSTGLIEERKWNRAKDILSEDTIVWKRIWLPRAGRSRQLWSTWLGKLKYEVSQKLSGLIQVQA